MKYIVRGTALFYKQLSELDKQTKRIVDNKIELLEKNPYRYKALHGYGFKLFRIRLKVLQKEARLIYAVIEPDIILLCFVSRDRDYRELKSVIQNLRRLLKEKEG